MKKLTTIFSLCIGLICFSKISEAQCLDCGNGSDGAFSANATTTLTSGTYNYTAFYIAPGVTVTATGSAPMIIKCTGPVNILGTLAVNGGNGGNGITFSTYGQGGVGVAGGANGGDGIYLGSGAPGSNGFGPGAGLGGNGWSGGGGAGYSANGFNSGGVGGVGGPAYGNTSINPVVAGSGGGGGSGGNSCGSGGGGAGGGILIISACNNITIGAAGAIQSNGGNGGSDGTGNCGGGGGGSGGSILLTADTIKNSGNIMATGGIGGASNVPGNPYYGTGANGAAGRIRFDYFAYTGAGTVNPPAGYTGQALPFATISSQTNVTPCNGDSNGTATAVMIGGTSPFSYQWSPSSQATATAINLQAGLYSVNITDSLGTSCTASVNITEPAPIITTVTLGMVICEGNCGTVIMTPSGGGGPPYTYLWTPGNITTPSALVCPDSTTSYTCTVWDSQGCSATATTVVTVSPLPTLTLSAQHDTACLNQTTNVLTGTPAGGSYLGLAVTGNIFNPSFAGLGIHSVSYTYTDTAGCTDTISIPIVVDICAGIEARASERPDVFPNPAGNSFQVHSLSPIRYIEMINATGRLVYSSYANAEKTVVNTSAFAEGIYLLRIQLAEGFVNQRIVIKH